LRRIKSFPYLVKRSGDVEATLPFPALKRKENLTSAIKIAEPFTTLFIITEMLP